MNDVPRLEKPPQHLSRLPIHNKVKVQGLSSVEQQALDQRRPTNLLLQSSNLYYYKDY